MAIRSIKGLTILCSCAMLSFFGGVPKAFAGQSDVEIPKADVQAKNLYSDGEGNLIEILGIASVASDEIRFWTPSGVMSESLKTEFMDACLREQRVELSFRFGKKNRYILVRQESKSGYIDWRTSKGESIYPAPISFNPGKSLNLLQVSIEDSAKSLTLLAGFQSSKATKIELPYRLGAKIRLFDLEYEVGPNRPYQLSSSRRNRRDYLEGRIPDGSKYWTTDFFLKNAMNPAYISGSFSVCDSEKEPILHVDRKGNPVSPVNYLSDPEPESNYDRFGFLKPNRDKTKHKYVKAVFIPIQTLQGTTTYVTNIDPSKIGSLQISSFTKEVVQFAEIPLDPIQIMHIIGGTTAQVSSDSQGRR